MSFQKVLNLFKSTSGSASVTQSREMIDDIPIYGVGSNKKCKEIGVSGYFIERDEPVLISAGGSKSSSSHFSLCFCDTEESFYELDSIKRAHDFWITDMLEVSENKVLSCSHDEKLKIWDLETGKMEKELKQKEKNKCVNSMFKIRHGVVLCGLHDGEVVTWNVEKSEVIDTFVAHKLSVSKIVSLKKNKYATCSWDKRVKIWDFKKKKCSQEFYCHKLIINTMYYDKRNDILFTGGADKKVKMYSIGEEKEIESIDIEENVCCVLAIPSKNYVIVGDGKGNVKILDVRNGNSCVNYFKGHEDKIFDIQELPYGRFATASNDGMIKIWDLEKGKNFKNIKSHKKIVSSLYLLKKL